MRNVANRVSGKVVKMLKGLIGRGRGGNAAVAGRFSDDVEVVKLKRVFCKLHWEGITFGNVAVTFRLRDDGRLDAFDDNGNQVVFFMPNYPTADKLLNVFDDSVEDGCAVANGKPFYQIHSGLRYVMIGGGYQRI